MGDKIMNKKTEKYVIALGAFAIATLMISSATAAPQIQGTTIINQIDIEKQTINQSEQIEGISIPGQNPDLDELIDLLNFEGFRDYFKSIEFANLICSYDISDIVNSIEFLDFLNTIVVQTLINHEVFTDFLDSEDFQIFIDNLNNNENSPEPTPSYIMGLLGLLIGLLTWIPAWIICWIIALPAGILAGILGLLFAPTDTLLGAAAFMVVTIALLIAGPLWPLVCFLGLGIW